MIDVLKLQRRTMRYEFADGIRDFQSAFWLLTMGVYIWLFWDKSSVWMPAFNNLARSQGRVMVVLAVSILAIGLPLIVSEGGLRLINEYVRRRWLWCETGYVTPKKWIVPRRTLFLALGLMTLVLVGGIE